MVPSLFLIPPFGYQWIKLYFLDLRLTDNTQPPCPQEAQGPMVKTYSKKLSVCTARGVFVEGGGKCPERRGEGRLASNFPSVS